MVYVMDYYAYSENHITDFNKEYNRSHVAFSFHKEQDNRVEASPHSQEFSPFSNTHNSQKSKVINVSRYKQRAPKIITPKRSHE